LIGVGEGIYGLLAIRKKVEKQFFRLWYRLDNADKYIIWILDEMDEVFTQSGIIPFFSSQVELLSFANEHQFQIVEEDSILHNLDQIQSWLQNTDGEIDCRAFLSAWNLFTDVTYSLKCEFIGNQKDKVRNKIYDKLFFGCNLPAITPEGQHYQPEWTQKEKNKLVEIMQEGLKIVRENFKERQKPIL
jgi:hypothetical protein